MKIRINNNQKIVLPIRLNEGDSIVYEGGPEAVVYSNTWQILDTIEIAEASATIASGPNSVSFDPAMNSTEAGTLRIEIRLKGESESVIR